VNTEEKGHRHAHPSETKIESNNFKETKKSDCDSVKFDYNHAAESLLIKLIEPFEFIVMLLTRV
jgi:hypothetical protein